MPKRRIWYCIVENSILGDQENAVTYEVRFNKRNRWYISASPTRAIKQRGSMRLIDSNGNTPEYYFPGIAMAEFEKVLLQEGLAMKINWCSKLQEDQ